MNKIVILAITFFVISLPSVYPQDDRTTGAGGMQFFSGTWSEVLAAAKEQNKYIFVDAFADWCVPCKMMASKVFPTEEAGKFYNENFISYKLDMEKGEGVDFAKKYEVNVYPTYLYFNPSGGLVHRSVGGKPVDMFIEDGKNALSPEKNLSAMREKYEKGDRSELFLYDYAFALSNAYQNPVKISEVAAAYLSTQKDEDLANEKNWKIINELLNDVNSRAFKYLTENKDKFTAKYGQEKVESKIITTQLEHYKSKKNWNEYAKLSNEYVNKNAMNDWTVLNSFAWDFYENISDKSMLKNAEKWAKKSIELDKNYYNTDTYASILYKLGKYEKALKKANEAIELAKKSGIDYKGTEELIKKINRHIETED